jgi:hypothetical protein
MRCAKGQLCCAGTETRCVPKSPSTLAACIAERATAIECDESSDCAAGELCCHGVIYDKEANYVACKRPAACAIPLSRPGSFPIPGSELCARGGSCRDKRLACVDDPQMPSGGTCMSAVGNVACGDQGRCPPDRPWCLWDPPTRTATCIPRGPWQIEDGVHQCDGPEDCVGKPCCTANGRSFCSMDCTEAFRFAAELCHKDADCLGPNGENETQKIVWRCAPPSDVDGLPGLRQCEEVVLQKKR